MYRVHPSRTSAFKGRDLSSVIASTCFHLEATSSDSYDGSGQTWANLVAAPADGELQTAYDFFLGADGDISADDPEFTGSAGDEAAYFNHTGDDLFTLKSGSNTAFLNGLHMTSGDGGPWWYCSAFRSTNTGFAGMMGTITTSIQANGVEIFIDIDVLGTSVRLNVRRGAGNNVTNNDFGSGLTADTNYLICISSDPTNTDDIKGWINTTTKTVDTDASPYTSSIDSDGPLRLSIARSFNFDANTRAYTYAMGNSYIDDADVLAMFDFLEALHPAGRYTIS